MTTPLQKAARLFLERLAIERNAEHYLGCLYIPRQSGRTEVERALREYREFVVYGTSLTLERQRLLSVLKQR